MMLFATPVPIILTTSKANDENGLSVVSIPLSQKRALLL